MQQQSKTKAGCLPCTRDVLAPSSYSTNQNSRIGSQPPCRRYFTRPYFTNQPARRITTLLRGSSYPSTTAVVCRYAPAQYISNTQGTGIIGKRGAIRVESVSTIQTTVMLTRVCVVHLFPLHSKTLSLVTAQQPGLFFVWSMPQLSNLLFFGIFSLLES